MILENLGFSRSTYSEVILTVKLGKIVNSAPMGALLNDQGEICLRIYRNQRTYRMIVNGAKDCVLNITDNPVLFYNTIFEKEKISYISAKRVSSPRILNCKAYVECLINDIEIHEDFVKAFLKPLLIDTAKEKNIKTYNRAGPAIIEALICYSKLLHFKNIDRERAKILKKRIEIFKEIVYHSTTDSTLRKIASKILAKSEETL
ncbi:DUF447 family protein [Candidatus Bathyarchaeota archaeon]|nr:MAG: DUF447 family protein [Candidatus Bathyarchaeota archaeon]